MANEKKVVLTTVRIDKSDKDVPFLRLEYDSVPVVNESLDSSVAQTIALISANVSKPIIDVMSSSKFTTDANGNQTPDIAAATEWCNKMGPAFGALKKAQFQFTAREYEVKVQPYYRKNSDGSVNTSIVYDTMSVWVILNPQTNEPWTPNTPQSKANSRLKNGGNMYQLVSTYQKVQGQQAQAQDILTNLGIDMSQSVTQEF